MKKTYRTVVMTIGALLFTAGNAWANTVVYDRVELFQTQAFFTDTFAILDAGNYRATLTDFAFPVAMMDSGMSVTTTTDSLGSLMAPGSFTFNATAGNYFVSVYGAADTLAPLELGLYGIEISQVPVPAAIWLFASGLLGLVGIAKRKKAA